MEINKKDPISRLMERYKTLVNVKDKKDGIFMNSKELSELVPMCKRAQKDVPQLGHISETSNDAADNIRTKNHKRIREDIKALKAIYKLYPEALGGDDVDDLIIDSFYRDSYNRQQPCFDLTEEGFLLVISQYDPIVRGLLVTLYNRIKKEKPDVMDELGYNDIPVENLFPGDRKDNLLAYRRNEFEEIPDTVEALNYVDKIYGEKLEELRKKPNIATNDVKKLVLSHELYIREVMWDTFVKYRGMAMYDKVGAYFGYDLLFTPHDSEFDKINKEVGSLFRKIIDIRKYLIK